MNQESDASVPISVSNLTKNDNEDFSLDDLANEYLQDEPSPTLSTEQSVTSTDFTESDIKLDDPSKNSLSPSVSTPIILNNNPLSPSSDDILLIKSPLDSILFSNRLSSHDAADEADCIWKEESSALGKMFCTKTIDIQTQVTKRISTCLFDRNLYERLTHLVALLPKECVRNNFQQFSVRPNSQSHQQFRQQRQNNDDRRPMHRSTFQQNFTNANSPNQRHTNAQNPRQYVNASYSNQQTNPGGNFVDRKQQQQQHWNSTTQSSAHHSNNQRVQQQDRYSSGPASAQQSGNPHHHHPHHHHQQQQQRTPQSGGPGGRNPNHGRNQQASNDYHPNRHQRGPQKGSGGAGNKLINEKSGVPGSGPSLNPK